MDGDSILFGVVPVLVDSASRSFRLRLRLFRGLMEGYSFVESSSAVLSMMPLERGIKSRRLIERTVVGES